MQTRMFDKILIANRGEIACRVIATCRRLGIATVAVYSDADRDARHVRLADEAIHIGAAPASESYLRGEVILAAAVRSGAQAIHPGYGFLSENAGFAEACAAAGIVFIGPPAQAIRAMGDKSAAKALMQRAGVPLTPGYHGDEQAPGFLQAQAESIGWPVLIKASAGGGGKGMRRVEDGEHFADALASCQREARNAFGNDHVLVEKYVERPRHIEVQVFGDTHGNLMHLFERDCSVQRRHQKVLEEAPAPGMSAERRAAMGAAAVEAARAVGYVGAGTVEFIVAPDGAFYFMEMNTRLQVEHPVTEAITGTDLVEWQLRVAAGDTLPCTQQQLAIHGHAIEARLYAEDASRGFLPSTGTLRHLRLPTSAAHVRVDTGIEQGDAITPYYDPMIAKVIAWGEDRATALRRLQAALAGTEAIGVTTNAGFLVRLLQTSSFAEAQLDTALIEREHAALVDDADIGFAWLAAAALLASPAVPPSASADTWEAGDDWRAGVPMQRRLILSHAGTERTLVLGHVGDAWQVEEAGTQRHLVLHRDGDAEVIALTLDGHRHPLSATGDGDAVVIHHRGVPLRFARHIPGAADAADSADGMLRAPMPGRIIALLAEPGSRVTRGQPLLVMEAMKMEHTIVAPGDGYVRTLSISADAQVVEGQPLISLDAARG